MAYDKVVDSSVLDAGLKQIANAIREKGGTSDNLAFPQAMADAIAAIEAGGGGIEIIKYTPAENVSKPVISHSLGSVPAAAIIIAETDPDDVPMITKSVAYGFTKGTYHNTAPYYNTTRLSTWDHRITDSYGITSHITGNITGVLFCDATETSIRVLNSANVLSAGVTYLIILFAEGVWV